VIKWIYTTIMSNRNKQVSLKNLSLLTDEDQNKAKLVWLVTEFLYPNTNETNPLHPHALIDADESDGQVGTIYKYWSAVQFLTITDAVAGNLKTGRFTWTFYFTWVT